MPLTSEKHPVGDVASSKSDVDEISESKVEEEVESKGNASAGLLYLLCFRCM